MDLLNDVDYQDYRELICYERPACVLLHYVHGVKNLRTQLYDRFFFERRDGQMLSQSNNLNSFLGKYGVHQNLEKIVSSKNDLMNLLMSYAETNSKDSALILPYFNQVGSSKVLSTWLLEFDVKNNSKGLLTSLRGDDFFFRKKVELSEVVEKLHTVDGILKFQSLHFSSDIIEYKSISSGVLAERTGVSGQLNILAKLFLEKRVSGAVMGAQALWEEYRLGVKEYKYWKNLVEEGFHKALLVKLFWPIQFFYQPFAVFLKYCFNSGIIFRDQSFIDECRLLIEELTQNAQVLASISGIFTFRRDEASFKRFCDALERSLTVYEKIESLFLQNQLGCNEAILLSDSLSFYEKATEQLLAVKVLPFISSNIEGIVPFPLSDYSNVKADKYVVRKILENTEYHVDYIFSTEFDSSDFKRFTYPFVLKSSIGFASGGTFLIHSDEELITGLRAIKNLNRFVFRRPSETPAGVLAERFIPGSEYAVECITVGGKTRVVGVFSKPDNLEKNFLDSVYVMDPEVQRGLSPQVQQWVEGLLKSVGYSDGPSHIEFRIDGENTNPALIEINFRPGGSGILASLIYMETGIPVLGLMAKSLKKTLSWDILQSQSFTTPNFLFCNVPEVGKAGIIKRIRGREALKEHHNIFWSEFRKKEGEYITPPPAGTDYLGKILGKASSLDDLNRTLKFISTYVGVDYECD